MKIEISKLNKNIVNTLSGDVTFKKEDYAQVKMLRDILSCHIQCQINDYSSIIEVNLTIEAELILECSYSLEDVNYHLKHREILEFSDEIEDEDIIAFDGNTIDIDKYVLELIIAKIPVRIKKQGAKTIEVDGVKVMSEDELEAERNATLDPRLKALDDWKE